MPGIFGQVEYSLLPTALVAQYTLDNTQRVAIGLEQDHFLAILGIVGRGNWP